MKILIIEDDKKVANFIKKGLSEEMYKVEVAYNGEDGLFKAEEGVYDLIILDLMLPKMNGIEICKILRKNKIDVPVLMLTARDAIEDKIEGFDSGTDDYLTKPFAFEELLARIRALLRRTGNIKNAVLKYSDLEMDLIKHTVKRRNKLIELTPKEYQLLEYFMNNPEQVITRTMIAEKVWDYNFDSFTNVVDVYVNYLRNKIDKGFKEKLIHTQRGIGYILKEEK